MRESIDDKSAEDSARNYFAAKFPNGIVCSACGKGGWSLIDVTVSGESFLASKKTKRFREMKFACAHCALVLSFLVSPRASGGQIS